MIYITPGINLNVKREVKLTGNWCTLKGLIVKVKKGKKLLKALVITSNYVAKRGKFNFHRLSFDFQKEEWSQKC